METQSLAMNEQDKKVMALMALAANFGGDFPECLLGIWLDLLSPYPAKIVNVAVREVICEYEYKTIPPFAVLKRFLDKATGVIGQEKILDMQAEGEWGKLLNAIHELGFYKGPPKDLHPATAYALRNMGGWEAACRWETDKLEWRHKTFIETWKLAHGNEEAMALGARAVEAIGAGPQSASEIMKTLLPAREIIAIGENASQ